MEHTTKNLDETKKIAATFISSIVPHQDKACIVGLCGDLGSGKTAFTQGIAEALGVKEKVTSPTFVIQKSYNLDGQKGFEKLIHIDAYRLLSSNELTYLNLQEIFNNPKNLICIEWPERIMDALPKEMLKLDFQFVDPTTRKIKLSNEK